MFTIIIVVIDTKENSLIPNRIPNRIFVYLICGTPLYCLEMKQNVIGIRTYLMKCHKTSFKVTDFLFFVVMSNKESMNN